MDTILQQLTAIELVLKKPFPTRDIQIIEGDFRREFLSLSGDVDFFGDFHYYCANIAGTLSYVMIDAVAEMPQ